VNAGLYIHVPFCARKCGYCDFYSRTYESGSAGQWLDAADREWDLLADRDEIRELAFGTVYVGGGTPSVLSAAQWERLSELVARCLRGRAAEFTVECNPESFDCERARVWADSGVTRLSLGVQSLDDNLLRVLGRPHDARRALEVLGDPALERFASVGVDVIYGVPGQTIADVRGTLAQLLERGPLDHVSAYELTLSGESPMGRDASLTLPAEDLRVEMYHAVEDQLVSAGFEHYEVSNYARPGRRSRHNSAYWRHESYIGLGPSAHSLLMPRRWSNVADVAEYAAKLGRGELPVAHEETLGRAELVREALMLGLRTSEGLDPAHFQQVTGEALEQGARAAALAGLVSGGLLTRSQGNYVPTSRGMLLADALALRLC
jgi:oxygen-independent coproporphyrinogen-3 oxidase